MNDQNLKNICRYIQDNAGPHKPKVGIVLGSGLGLLADDIEDAVVLPYKDIPGFPVGDAPGHARRLVLGNLAGVPVMCMQGRVHRYEGVANEDFQFLIRAFKGLGCSSILITNASGSLREEIGPGELVLINDHINLQWITPLMGLNDDEVGPRFLPMADAYDKKLRDAMHATADKLDIALHDGVNASVLGPCYETPAEIRAFKAMGADVINMSTIPEVIVARHCGLRVAAIAVVTNLGAGMGAEVNHDEVVLHAKRAADKLKLLVNTFLKDHEKEF